MFSYKTSVHNLCPPLLSPTSQENYVIFFNHAKIFSFSWISSAMVDEKSTPFMQNTARSTKVAL